MSTVEAVLSPECSGLRLDRALALTFPEQSRSFWQKRLLEGMVWVDGLDGEADDRVEGGESITAEWVSESALEDQPENIPINVVDETDDFMVINKPAGLTVHPGNGQRDGTLLNALLYHRPNLAQVARAGIVHRLDKQTTGLMVIAKRAEIRQVLVGLLADRHISREYVALVKGQLGQVVGEEGTINAAIGRHPTIRTQMTVLPGAQGKPAITHYRVLQYFSVDGVVRYSLVHCRLQSGRTHQIRVHLSHIGHPLVGDSVYVGEFRARSDPLKLDKILARQALHAFYLGFSLPDIKTPYSWQAPLPEDFQALLQTLRNA